MRVLLRLVGDDVDDLRAELELAELVGGEEAGAGVVGLVAERAIELGRMADRLVDRQPQIRRMQDQRLLPGRRRLRLVRRDGFFGRDARFLRAADRPRRTRSPCPSARSATAASRTCRSPCRRR